MLKLALNAVTAIHSRAGTLKRIGTPNIYSPCRLTPSNYFAFLRGPEFTSIKQAEFIIPVDTLTGQYAQKFSFDNIPDEGQFKLQFGSDITDALDFNCTAVDIQTALRAITALENCVVTGSFLLGFTITFVGFDTAPAMGQVVDTTLKFEDEGVNASWVKTSTLWSDLLKKGDRIVDGSKNWTVGDIMEMNDIGAEVMAYRVRCE